MDKNVRGFSRAHHMSLFTSGMRSVCTYFGGDRVQAMENLLKYFYIHNSPSDPKKSSYTHGNYANSKKLLRNSRQKRKNFKLAIFPLHKSFQIDSRCESPQYRQRIIKCAIFHSSETSWRQERGNKLFFFSLIM